MSEGLKFKVTVIGNGAVGKTSLIKKYTQGEFTKEYIATLGAQFTTYSSSVNDIPVEIIFWDVAGQDNPAFSALRKNFYKGSSGAIIVFSHEDSEHGNRSFQDIKKWFNDLKKNLGGSLPIILFGNKIDLVDEGSINTEQVDALVKELNFLGYYKTSALSGANVADAFENLTKKLVEVSKYLA